MTGTHPAERRHLTVMLCDMVASTALSLKLDPEELAEVIQSYRQRCAEVIADCGGIVARYVGDGILAYFGYPRAHENDAERAIRAALGIAETRWPVAGSEDVRVHIGIATGLVVVGDLFQGGEELAAIGSALNLAARLEALAEPGAVLVSEETRRLARGLFEYSDLGRHDLKGFDKPMPAWRVIGERRLDSRFRALRAPALTPLVDRQQELDTLREAWNGARTGRGQAILMASEAGVGKSRLADVLARRIVDPAALRLWYHCSPNLQASPMAPVIRQLVRAARFAQGDDDDAKMRKLEALVPTEATEAGQTVPLLADLLSVRHQGNDPALGMSPQRRKLRLFQVLMRLLEAFAARAPALIIVEDLHWIDPSSDELIGVLIERLRDLPILAVLTARLEFEPHWPERPYLHHLVLSPLGRRDTLAMIGLVCGDRSIPRSAVEQIADRTDGMPLFIEDLTREVLESAALSETDGRPGGIDVALAIPATLSDSLMARLDRLGSAKRVAEIGAVIGREFSYELLARVSDLPEAELRDELRRLVDAGLLSTRRPTAALSYAFKHALVRDAAYASLLRKRQAALHARIARTLIDHFPETAERQPEVVAYHLQSANEVGDAVDYLVRAAKLSARRSGFAEAIAQLESALALLRGQARSKERLRLELDVQRTLGGIYAEYRGFSSTECGRAYTTALDLCRELGDAPEIFAVLSGLGSYEITRAGFARCRTLAEECLARAAAQSSKPPFVMGHLLLGGTLFLTGELAAACEHLEEAISLYDQDQPARRPRQVLYVQDQKSTGLCYLGLALTIMGRLEDGLRAAEASLAHSRSLGGLHTVNFSLCYLAAVHHIRGDAAAALQRATESLESAREQGFATWIGISQTIRGASLIAEGHIEDGLAELRQGLAAHLAMEATTYEPFARALVAKGLIAAQRSGEALDELARALAVSEASGERFYAGELLRLKGEALAAAGQRTPAEQCLREAIEVSRRGKAKLFELRSALGLCRILDEPRRRAAVAELLAPICEGFADTRCADVRDARLFVESGIAGGPHA
ncbi:MAG TPA: adenylate/guanylate cyclase domain-containing protein [Casimicrobiaceae bacterium]|nr:adenylate/guanylate cyclase domain-containing protein [Casimicrobiaceae bacterium]